MIRISIAVLRQRDQGSHPYRPRDVLCDRTPLRRRLRKRVRLEGSTESLLSRWRNDETRDVPHARSAPVWRKGGRYS